MNLLLCLSILAAVVVIWCTVPALWVLCLPGVPMAHRRAAALSFGHASLRGLAMLPADLLAPLVVPFALLGCRWESENLPRWARWWDNDVGLNGDNFPVWRWDEALGRGVHEPVPLADTPEIRALCYWAPGHHPRSFYARWIWLGLRNRASALAVTLGQPADYSKPVQEWGDPATGRDHAGWLLREHAGLYQFYATRQLGRLCLRTNYGYKVGFTSFHRERLPVVCITASLLRRKGTEAATATG